jgi:hypothetical protein
MGLRGNGEVVDGIPSGVYRQFYSKVLYQIRHIPVKRKIGGKPVWEGASCIEARVLKARRLYKADLADNAEGYQYATNCGTGCLPSQKAPATVGGRYGWRTGRAGLAKEPGHESPIGRLVSPQGL